MPQQLIKFKSPFRLPLAPMGDTAFPAVKSPWRVGIAQSSNYGGMLAIADISAIAAPPTAGNTIVDWPDEAGNVYHISIDFDQRKIENCRGRLDDLSSKLSYGWWKSSSDYVATTGGFVADPALCIDFGDGWTLRNGTLQRITASGSFAPIDAQLLDPIVSDVFFPFAKPMSAVEWPFEEQGIRATVNVWTRCAYATRIKGFDLDYCLPNPWVQIGEVLGKACLAFVAAYLGGPIAAVLGIVSVAGSAAGLRGTFSGAAAEASGSLERGIRSFGGTEGVAPIPPRHRGLLETFFQGDWL